MADISTLTPGTWTVDASHSTIGFVVRHLVVAKTRGRFGTFEGTITIAENPLDSKVTASVDTASVNTNDEGRDNHLRTGDFFEAETHPKITFASTSIVPDGGDYKLNGDLTIKGVTKPVTFDLEFEGVVTDPWGNTKAGFTAETEVNRKDWGLDYNAVLEAGGVLIGEKVKLTLEIEALKA
ncbi:MAG: polyisoprenoid-binding protein [Ilumatobacteraceae bacterium]|nr:polyisoprenoid-binding protein [Ilumatobacteraceae bacterium]